MLTKQQHFHLHLAVFFIVFVIICFQAITSSAETTEIDDPSNLGSEKVQGQPVQFLKAEKGSFKHEMIKQGLLEAYQKGQIADLEDAQKLKEKIVADVARTVNKGPKYTIRVGLSGERKPIPTISGLTVRDRSIEWLETAGLGYTFPTWEKLATQYKIYYTLPICIAWADSHLGKALKSTNNIGNIGNNDRGDVVHISTLEKGIEAIYQTLNNKWMGASEQLWQLSGEGRIRMKERNCNEAHWSQKCYATSKTVWSTNVSNCMSVLHDTQISENFYFRLNIGS